MMGYAASPRPDRPGRLLTGAEGSTRMSTVDADVEVADVPVPEKNDLELTEARPGRVGPITVRRMLPLRTRRSVTRQD